MDNKMLFKLKIAANELELEELSQKLKIILSDQLKIHFNFIFAYSIFKNDKFKNLEKKLHRILPYTGNWKNDQPVGSVILPPRFFIKQELPSRVNKLYSNNNTSKIEGTNEIIGGFNPLTWGKTKKGHMKTNKIFMFSFKDCNIQNSILSRVKNEREMAFSRKR
ncbi:hypothetical protein Glove_67g103 [Diversispora epigaea]|uniref:Uncharacterized protein n=1 Tax=Diversispora epigaea TaxID=1348612 RepID=A0A397JK31_9GLOM|nr:hypothetical protein Glove_67g103 [Diversispora epigaea]